MLFTFLLTLATCQSFGMRPDMGILSKVVTSNPSVALQEAAKIVHGIMLQRNATDHISEDDQALLRSVVDLIDKSIFGSMDSSHQADVNALAAAVAAANQCNTDFAARLASDGDLGGLQTSVNSAQGDLDVLLDEFHTAILDRDTKRATLETHMDMIAVPPGCPGLPDRTKPSLDVYFDQSDYANWYTAQQASYDVVNTAFEDSETTLDDVVERYAVQLATRNVRYCDWKDALEKGCTNFNTCFDDEANAFLNTLIPQIEDDVEKRKEAFKSGTVIIAQIEFLLGTNASSEPPTDIDVSRYDMEYPPLPSKDSCPLELLDDPKFNPEVTCAAPSAEETLEQVEEMAAE